MNITEYSNEKVILNSDLQRPPSLDLRKQKLTPHEKGLELMREVRDELIKDGYKHLISNMVTPKYESK